MSGTNGNTSKIASVQRQGERIVVLVGERGAERVTVTARTIPEREWAATAASLVEQGVGRMVCVIPGAETIARVAMVPSADVGAMVQAASLLAEAELPESIPGHRRAAGVLTGFGEGGNVPALLAGWRGDATWSLAAVEGCDLAWCPVIGALAALRGTGEASAWFADPGDGSISVLAGTGSTLSARVVIEDNSSAVLWGEGVAATVGEELDDGGMTARLGVGEAAIEWLTTRVSGVTVTRGWLDVHGAALGALLIAVSGDPALGALARMLAQPPRVVEHPVLRAAAWIGEKRHAAWVTAAALVLLLGAPFGVAWARVKILDARSQSLTKANETRKELNRRAAVYAELASTRWPMTKLMSDISQATPLGVVVTELRIQPETGAAGGGDAGGITLDGSADTQAKMYDLQANLNKAELFRDVKVKTSTAKADGGVTFQIVCGVSNPHGSLPKIEDWNWATKNIAIRKYGEGASVKTPPEGKVAGTAEASKPARRPARGEGEDSGDRKSADKKESGGVPPELTDEQIGKMDRVAAMREFSARRKYSQSNPSLDAATKRRLEEDVTRLQARIRAAMDSEKSETKK